MASWKEKKTEKGVLKYRHPNIVEGYDFLAAIDKIQTLQDAFKVKGNFISKMQSMIDYNSIGYASWEDFLDDRENNLVAMAEIADEVFVEITKTLGKKHT
jgi:hypothetical protein